MATDAWLPNGRSVRENSLGDTVTIERRGIEAHKCDTAVFEKLIFVAGQVADNVGADIEGQTAEVLAKLEGFLVDAGSDASMILSASIWLTDISLRERMNSVWNRWLAHGKPPARSCVEAQLAIPGALIEIALVAAKKN